MVVLILLICLVFNYSQAQNKKDQIENLTHQIDSLKIRVVSEQSQSVKKSFEIDSLKNQLKISNNKVLELLDGVSKLEYSLNQKTDSIKVLIEQSAWIFDSRKYDYTKDCIHYNYSIPYVHSSPFSDSINSLINIMIASLNFDDFGIDTEQINCKEQFKDWSVGLCPAPLFHETFLEKLEHKKYISIVYSVLNGYCGTTAPFLGHLSFNMRVSDRKQIEFNETVQAKEKLLLDVSNYYANTPFRDVFFENENYKFDIVESVKNLKINDLTFYFKNDKLYLIFWDGALTVYQETHEIPLPIYQEFMQL